MTDDSQSKGPPRPATLKDIARALKVDVSTVSKVLSGGGISVRSETRQAIIDEAHRLNYRAHASARNLRTRRTGAMGILLPNLMNPVYASIVRGAVRRAEETGYVMLVADVEDEASTTSVYLRLVSERRVDGLIIAVSARSKEIISVIEDNPIPHVFVNRRASIGRSVTVDDQAAGYLAAKTLVEAGHTRLGFIGDSDDLDTAQRRRAGFLRGCIEAGLPPFLDVVGPYSRKGGYESALKLLDAPERPTGVFASNLLVGIGALAAMRVRKVRVPEDISIITLDAEDAIYASPPLTAIATSLLEMGARAVDEVDAILHGREPQDVVIESPPRLIMRESLGPPPKPPKPSRPSK
ncbi:MAG: LacI family DNA-binding transcriptional regulator [Devosia nanyangense]|uniref:LacI family DNA-binding transcriptional regulator n=1 Tax=Devosia nanyangense TaxID=1228055 RepID=A0A933NYD5_9HYPH|nr:LacI family DNA-binding transcriptional regulator [Devosia nanyangense]